METATRKQVGPTHYGRHAKQTAEQWCHDLFEWNDQRDKGDRQIATPWANWTVEERDGGWAVFVTEVA